MQTINFLGVGNSFDIINKNTSAYYKKDDLLLLIDCGETVFETIINENLLYNINRIDILITHMHSDHVGSLGTLLFYLDKINIQNVNVYYPNKEVMKQFIKIIQTYTSNYKIYKPEENELYKIKSIKQKHSIFEAYGYLLNINNSIIYYSGDTKIIKKEILDMFIDGEIDEFYQDVTMLENTYHISLEELSLFIPKELRSKINCMHYSNDIKEKIEERGFSLVKRRNYGNIKPGK